MKPCSIDMKNEAIRAALSAIAEANGGYLNPAHVVDAARDASSVLHDEFAWDDEEAAEFYRLAQAGALIRRVKFQIVKQDPKTKAISIMTTRAYQSRPSTRGNGGYESIEAIMADDEKREELLQQVLRELSAYRKRYAELSALTSVWNAIDSATDDLLDAPSTQAKAGQVRRGKARPGEGGAGKSRQASSGATRHGA